MNEEDKKEIKEVINGVGTVLAVAGCVVVMIGLVHVPFVAPHLAAHGIKALCHII